MKTRMLTIAALALLAVPFLASTADAATPARFGGPGPGMARPMPGPGMGRPMPGPGGPMVRPGMPGPGGPMVRPGMPGPMVGPRPVMVAPPMMRPMPPAVMINAGPLTVRIR